MACFCAWKICHFCKGRAGQTCRLEARQPAVFGDCLINGMRMLRFFGFKTQNRLKYLLSNIKWSKYVDGQSGSNCHPHV